MHLFMKKHKVPYTTFNTLTEFTQKYGSPTNPVYFDLFGSLFHFIKKQFYEGRDHWLLSTLVEMLKLSNLVVVFDGSRSLEKYDTSMRRMHVVENALDKVKSSLTAAALVPKLNKNHWKHLEKELFAAYLIPNKSIVWLKEQLSQAGVAVQSASMEADVFIAQQVAAIVVSKDGDYYCHKNVSVYGKFILQTRTMQVQVLSFNQMEILDRLGLASAQLSVLGILSGNDYVPNIKGYGCEKNFKLLKQANSDSHNDPILLIQGYVRNFRNTSETMFANASRIFLDVIETTLEPVKLEKYQELKANVGEQHAELKKQIDELRLVKAPAPKDQARPESELTHLRLAPSILLLI